MTKQTKKQKAMAEAVDREKLYTVAEAIGLVLKNATAKFDETVEISMNLGIDPRHSDQNLRGMTSLPHGTGKSARVAVFARDAKADEAKAAGADKVGAEDLMEDMQKGNLDYDRVIATPDMMPVVGRLGQILGPKGLMPNPKVGTVTPDVKKAVEAAKAGSIEFRAEKEGIVHAPIGKASFGDKKLTENLIAFYNEILRAKPSGAKGTYVKRVAISSSMGPGVKVSVDSLQEEKAAA
ncbi:MAG TPA: 50S ribosomal protein L1 [Rhodospirillaceae bacterium]|jgi:large subunit ribosomal protein L1|nr:50S ribosomal protein L1 [Rhodospirillaceae bacterium]|tara:strand:+ start:181 stop:891 length:711 start_codon:yes stop_codon:yes gene_type:complete